MMDLVLKSLIKELIIKSISRKNVKKLFLVFGLVIFGSLNSFASKGPCTVVLESLIGNQEREILKDVFYFASFSNELNKNSLIPKVSTHCELLSLVSTLTNEEQINLLVYLSSKVNFLKKYIRSKPELQSIDDKYLNYVYGSWSFYKVRDAFKLPVIEFKNGVASIPSLYELEGEEKKYATKSPLMPINLIILNSVIDLFYSNLFFPKAACSLLMKESDNCNSPKKNLKIIQLLLWPREILLRRLIPIT